MPTKPKRYPGNKGPGRPRYPELEIYIQFEASRRLTCRSINEHAKRFVITLLAYEGLKLKLIKLSGATLRSHIQAFIRKHVRDALPIFREGFERLIEQQIATWQKQPA